MIRHTIVVINDAACRNCLMNQKGGLHARPSARLSTLAKQFESEIYFVAKGLRVDVKDIMGVMMMAMSPAVGLRMEVDGPDEQEAAEAIARNFLYGHDIDCPDLYQYYRNLEAETQVPHDTLNPLDLLTAYTADLMQRGQCIQSKPCPDLSE